MASLSDLYNPTAPSGPMSQADVELASSDARTDAGLAQSRLQSNFANRFLPDLSHRYAARGTFYGGQLGVQADRAKEDVANQSGDIQRALDRQLAALRRSGIMAATGVALGGANGGGAVGAGPQPQISQPSPPPQAQTPPPAEPTYTAQPYEPAGLGGLPTFSAEHLAANGMAGARQSGGWWQGDRLINGTFIMPDGSFRDLSGPVTLSDLAALGIRS